MSARDLVIIASLIRAAACLISGTIALVGALFVDGTGAAVGLAALGIGMIGLASCHDASAKKLYEETP